MTISVLRGRAPQLLTALLSAWLMCWAGPAAAQQNVFDPGWDLDPDASVINFASVKFEKGEKIAETHSFATFSSSIESDGTATIVVKLDSVKTNVDLRNVRMRFLFFETFKYPDAVMTAKLTPDMVSGLETARQKILTIPFTFAIHGVSRQTSVDVRVALSDDDHFTVTSAIPFQFRVEEYGLADSLKKIAETAGGFEIVPQMAVTFELAYKRRGAGSAAQVVAVVPEPIAPKPTDQPAAAALETKGDFSVEECVGRFEILSEAGNIYFASGSARLDPESAYVLGSIVDIIRRCPSLRILISGHTDSDGSPDYNQTLSEKRARSVMDYLTDKGIERGRLASTGYGEDRPMSPNDTPFNKGRNRRIEFSLLN